MLELKEVIISRERIYPHIHWSDIYLKIIILKRTFFIMVTQNPVFPLRMFMFFASAISSVVISFLPIYFQFKGFTSSQIGWFLAIGPLVGLIAQPVWGYMSDKYKTVKKVLFACLFLKTMVEQPCIFYWLALIYRYDRVYSVLYEGKKRRIKACQRNRKC